MRTRGTASGSALLVPFIAFGFVSTVVAFAILRISRIDAGITEELQAKVAEIGN